MHASLLQLIKVTKAFCHDKKCFNEKKLRLNNVIYVVMF